MQNRLSITNTSPTANSINVKTDSKVLIYFDKNVSKSSIANNVILIDRNGDKVDCLIEMNDKIMVISSRDMLKPSSTYRVIIKGNNNPNQLGYPTGLTSPIGEYILGDYTFSFSTITPISETEYVVDTTPNNIAISHQPIFKGDVTNNTINVPKQINIVISHSNTFEPALIVWEGTCNLADFRTGISCNRNLPNGTYYWKARAVSEVHGEWSEVSQFAIENHSAATVVPDDYIDIDIAFDETWDMLDAKIINIFPDNDRSSVNNNLKTISITIDKIVPEQELAYANIIVTGNRIDGDIYELSHGEIEIEHIDVVYDHDNGVTILILTLPVIDFKSD